jgi:hypothetical protein
VASLNVRVDRRRRLSEIARRHERHVRQLGTLRALAGQRVVTHERLRAGVGEDVRDLLRLEQRVHRDDDRAER